MFAKLTLEFWIIITELKAIKEKDKNIKLPRPIKNDNLYSLYRRFEVKAYHKNL